MKIDYHGAYIEDASRQKEEATETKPEVTPSAKLETVIQQYKVKKEYLFNIASLSKSLEINPSLPSSLLKLLDKPARGIPD